jgi:hypothetical protein
MSAADRDVRDLARAAERVAADAGLESIAARLRKNRAERDRPGVRVAVVGDISRGKSTLINRLLGVDLLPTGSVPLTWAPVTVRALGAGAGAGVLDIRWPSGNAERRSLAEDDPWRGLVRNHEPSAGPVGEGQLGPAEPELLLSAPAPWLAGAEVELIDTPGLHEGRADHLLQTQRVVALSDVVVMAISAPAPLSLLERQFLAEELLTKRVPHVVIALTKLDQLPAAEQDDFDSWFRDRIAEISPGVAVTIGPGPAPGGAERLAELRDRISELAHSGNVIRRRDRRLAWQLADACAAISSAVQAASDQLAGDEAARHAAIVAAKDQLADDDVRWNQLRLGLDERRLRLTETLRDSVSASAAELFEILDVELHRVTDVKAWWERELPIRLRRELKSLVRALESQIHARISEDLGWLDREVARVFAVTRRSASDRRMSPVAVSKLPDLELADLRRRRTATRVINAAGGIVGTILAVASGTVMPAAYTIAGSTIAGLVADRDAEARTEAQRTEVRIHLRRLMDEVVGQFREQLFAEVQRSYQAAFSELQDAQGTWQAARLQALAATASTDRDITAWADIQRHADEIAVQIPADLADEPTDGFEQNDKEGDGRDGGE